MKRFLTAATAVLVLAGSVGSAAAKDNDRRDNGRYDQRYDRHDNGKGNKFGHAKWRKGGRIDRADWNRGHRVDYRRYRLSAPPRGYEWRQVDNSYVLAAVATGLIASILAAR